MEAIKLTQQQAEQLDHVFISDSTFINIVKDVNDIPFLFLSADDKIKIKNTDLSYLIDVPLSEYAPNTAKI